MRQILISVAMSELPVIQQNSPYQHEVTKEPEAYVVTLGTVETLPRDHAKVFHVEL